MNTTETAEATERDEQGWLLLTMYAAAIGRREAAQDAMEEPNATAAMMLMCCARGLSLEATMYTLRLKPNEVADTVIRWRGGNHER